MLNKTKEKVTTSPKICADTFAKFEVTDWTVNAVLTCTFWIIATIMHDWQLLSKNRQKCSKLHHLDIICSKYPYPARIKISDVDKLRRRIKNEWTVWTTLFIGRAVDAPASTCLRSCWRQTFRAYYDVKMMWLTTHLTIFETITASRVCRNSVNNDSLKCACKYCVDTQSLISNFLR